MAKKAIFNWSGGKDSAYALYKVLKQNEYEISCLLTTINSKFGRISMHGVREELLQYQAKNIGLPLKEIYLPESPSMSQYEEIFLNELSVLKESGIEYSIFGDIFLEDLRIHREKQLDKLGMRADFPLWKLNTREIVNDFIDKGFKAIVVAIDAKKLDSSFVGRILDHEFIETLPDDVDPCGENGEFHSFVFDGPIFNRPVEFQKGEIVHREYKSESMTSGFWFCDLLPANNKFN